MIFKVFFFGTKASKQMVFEVYMNVISTLEEFEKRMTTGQTVPRSIEPKAEFSSKTDQEIESQLSSQLILFEHQLKSCNREIVAETLEDLKHKTIDWVGCREEKGIGMDNVDIFVAKLYEILAIGTTTHPEQFYLPPGEVPDVPIETFQHVLSAKHQTKEFDRKFREDPNNVATVPETRSGSDAAHGVMRLKKLNPTLSLHLPVHAEDGNR